MSEPAPSQPSQANQIAAPLDWRDAAALLGAALALGAGLGFHGLYEPHEGHYAGIAREIVLGGDWIVPHMNGSPYLNKPPVMYWSIALAFKLAGGFSEGVARAPGAFYAWLGVVGVWLWGRRLWGAVAGRCGALALATAFGWFIFTRQIMPDILVSSIHIWTLYAAWRCAAEPDRRARWLAFWALVSLGMMTKGPPGVLFPLAAFLAWIAVARRWDLLRRSCWKWGLPLALAPVAIWALLVEARTPGFLRHAIINEMILRVANKRWPPDYQAVIPSALGYLIITLVWCGPWAIFIPQTVRFAWGSRRDPDAIRRAGVALLAFGALGPALLFLPMPSRLVYYCLPTVPAYAALCGGALASAGDRRWIKAGGGFGVALGAVIASVGFWIMPILRGVPEMQRAPETLGYVAPVAALLGIGIALGGIGLLRGRPGWGVAWKFVAVALAFGVGEGGFHAFEDLRSSRSMVAALGPRVGSEAVWISEGSQEMGMNAGVGFYLGQDAAGKPRVVLVMDDDERRPQPHFGAAPRGYAIDHAELGRIWGGPRPAVFFTDALRGDFTKDPPRLPDGAGEPVGEFGFRRVYANAAARARLGAQETRSIAAGQAGN